jgi:hypothetical protein
MKLLNVSLISSSRKYRVVKSQYTMAFAPLPPLATVPPDRGRVPSLNLPKVLAPPPRAKSVYAIYQ